MFVLILVVYNQSINNHNNNIITARCLYMEDIISKAMVFGIFVSLSIPFMHTNLRKGLVGLNVIFTNILRLILIKI